MVDAMCEACDIHETGPMQGTADHVRYTAALGNRREEVARICGLTGDADTTAVLCMGLD